MSKELSGNSLAEKFPVVAQQFDADKNFPLTVDSVTAKSSKKVWWKCDKGHSWEAVVKNRTSRGSGCPYCSGRRSTTETNISVTFPKFHQAMARFGTQDVAPEELKKTSKKVVHLQCIKGHTWEASPHEYGRAVGDLCPYCSNRKVLPGFNDLETLHPEVASLWDVEANGVEASHVPAKSDRHREKSHWVCSKGHKWKNHVSQVVKHPGCPICKGQSVVVGFNDMSVYAPELFEQLDDKHKTDEELEKILPYSNMMLHWVCPEGHGVYEAKMNKRSAGQGCPVCAGNKLVTGMNDLQTIHPDFLVEWDMRKNTISPSDITAKSSTKVWWKCDKGHSYEASPSKRSIGSGCPYCANKRVLPGFNDLATIRPDIAKRWHPTKNGDNSPEMFTFRSGFVAWWKCDKGHEWQSDIDHQSGGNSCPYCSHNVSKSEQEVAQYVKSIMETSKVKTSVRNIIPPQELDIYIPDKNIAIEFNGLYWHTEQQGKDKWYHYNKWKSCQDKGIQLITVWEDDWRDRRSVVESMLAHKLGYSMKEKVYARNTTVREITRTEAEHFLDKYHIQGGVSGTWYYALIDENNTIVAVSVWTHSGKDLLLSRYATSCLVVGGFGKLLKKGITLGETTGASSIVTFSDHELSDGSMYSKIGFKADKDLAPDYKYVVTGRRIHKFNYRKDRFKKDPDLLYIPGFTESKLASLNGIPRLYDCGKTRWILPLK